MMRFKKIESSSKFAKRQLVYYNKRLFLLHLFFSEKQKNIKNKQLTAFKEVIDGFREAAPAVNEFCLLIQLHVPYKLIPAPVHIVRNGDPGILAVINDRFGKMLRAVP